MHVFFKLLRLLKLSISIGNSVKIVFTPYKLIIKTLIIISYLGLLNPKPITIVSFIFLNNNN